jgi:hypothetical protein
VSQSRISPEVLAARQALREFELEQLAKPSGLRNWDGHGALAAALRLAERHATALDSRVLNDSEVGAQLGACQFCAAPEAAQ